MKNKTYMKQDIELKSGTSIVGKWHHQEYLIKRKLGSGTVGTVYLCESNGKDYALKISEQSAAMTVEVNVLKALRQVQDYRLGPSLIDVDDWQRSTGITHSFYVMDYLAGDRMDKFIKRNGSEWIGVLMLQLLGDLEKLHRLGWIFGDLKIDHLIVLPSPPRICFLDVGGTTRRGRSIKEYTEFYDRGYWGLGTRVAEPSYDLFAFAMSFIVIFYPNHFLKGENPSQMLIKRLNKVQALAPYRTCLQKAIFGKYATSAAMKQDIIRVLYNEQKRKKPKQMIQAQPKHSLLIESSGIILLAMTYYIISLLY